MLASETFKERGERYGRAYHQHGYVMSALMGPIELETPEDYKRFGVINMMVSKLCRYVNNFENGGHKDSAHDLIVYAAILEELTREK